MDFDTYQEKALTTAQYPADQALPYLALGLAGEAAEVANKVKKILRGDYDDNPEKAEAVLEGITKELGDVLWYIAVLADELDADLSYVADANIAKLSARASSGTIKGTGDDR